MEQPKSSNTVPFIIGLVVGLFVGGIPLTFLLVAATAMLAGAMHVPDKGSATAVFFLTLIPVAGLGVWSFLYARRAIDFFAGMLIGATAGLLGGTALCLVTLSSLGNMY